MDEGRKDPNWIAYITDLRLGKLTDYAGQYVLYKDGKFVAAAKEQSEILTIARSTPGISGDGGLVQKVNEEPVVHLVGLRKIRKQ